MEVEAILVEANQFAETTCVEVEWHTTEIIAETESLAVGVLARVQRDIDA